jgi:hypothetical protein
VSLGPIAAIVPLALGVAISPLPIVGMLVLLLTKGARLNSLVMLACWIVGNAIAIGIAIAFAGRIPQPRHGTDLTAEAVFASLVGLALIGMAAISWFGRKDKPGGGEPPAWLQRVDNLTPWGGALIALSNALTSPKNLALTLTAGVVISRATPSSSIEIASSAVAYVAIASVLIVIPVIFYFVGRDRSVAILTRWKANVTAHASAFIEIVLLVIGIAMTVRGVSNLIR